MQSMIGLLATLTLDCWVAAFGNWAEYHPPLVVSMSSDLTFTGRLLSSDLLTSAVTPNFESRLQSRKIK